MQVRKVILALFGMLLVINLSNSVLLQWFSGKTMKNSSTKNPILLATSYTSLYYRPVAIIDGTGDYVSAACLYERSVSYMVFKYYYSSGTSERNIVGISSGY